ncbi:MAG: hypothetical protein NZ807_03710, partial [Dehalococcoidia bacterium]|nr:hypothetical protein [Dehalococcoidia bacterium]
MKSEWRYQQKRLDIVGFNGVFYGRRIQASRKRLSGLLLASILCLLSNSAASARDLLETYQL